MSRDPDPESRIRAARYEQCLSLLPDFPTAEALRLAIVTLSEERGWGWKPSKQMMSNWRQGFPLEQCPRLARHLRALGLRVTADWLAYGDGPPPYRARSQGAQHVEHWDPIIDEAVSIMEGIDGKGRARCLGEIAKISATAEAAAPGREPGLKKMVG